MYSYSLHRDAHFRQLIITIRASTETTTAYPSALLLLAGLGSWHVFWEVHSNEQFLEDIIYSAQECHNQKHVLRCIHCN